MLINRKIDNIEKRISFWKAGDPTGEFEYIQNKYPRVALNVHDWWGNPNDRKRGKNILYATEGYITINKNYDPEHIKQYDAFITYSQKFKDLHPELNIYCTTYPPNWENYFQLDSFLDYDHKIKGVCSLQRVYYTGSVGDVNHMKDKIMRELNVEPHLVLHTYGPAPFGKKGSYQGTTPKFSSYGSLKIINKYLFCWCPEPMYHELWSHNWISERLFNCFKAKTVAIYFGCYNIEEIVPDDIFIDFRKFSSIQHLSEYLIELSSNKKKYTQMVEDAYNWNLQHTIGDMRIQEQFLQHCTDMYPF